MTHYTVFSEVSSFIQKKLREKLCPEPIVSTSMIEVISPNSSNVDYTLGVYLYDIKEFNELNQAGMVSVNDNTQRMPPTVYELDYMIFVNTKTQSGIKEIDIHKIFGRVAQVMADNGVVLLQNEGVYPPPNIVSAKLTLEEKSRIWTALNIPYNLCLMYKVYPVYLESERIVKASRVRESTFILDDKKGK